MDHPFFSIVITTYNRADLLSRALDSLNSQSFSSWEAILIDDGSMDGTEEKIRPYLNKNIVYRFQKNQGIITAKNNGISLTKGEYVTFLDSDDEYLADHLESRHEILQKNKDIDFLHGGVKIIGDPYVPDLHNPKNPIHLSKCAIGGSFFVKHNIIIKLNGFSGSVLGMDAHLLEKAQRNKVKILRIEEPRTYIYHRENLDSFTHMAKNLHSS